MAAQAAEGDPVEEADPDTLTRSAAVTTVAGHVDVSQQLFDRSAPPVDEVIATALGRSYGALLDAAIVTAALAATGTTAVTASTASSTANLQALGKLVADTSTAAGQKPDVLALHPRRAAYIRTTKTVTADWPVPESSLVETAGIPTNVSTNQDVALALVDDAVLVFSSEPTFRVTPRRTVEPGGHALTVRIQAVAYIAVLVRDPSGAGKLTGAGLAAPSFTT